MDMNQALISHLEQMLASDKIDQSQRSMIVDELHRVRRRVVRPRDASKDHEPITVGIAR